MLVLVTTVVSRISEDTLQFVEDYFTFKYVRIVSGFTCTKYDSFQVTKFLMSSGKFWMVSPDPAEPSVTQLTAIMKRGYHKFAVFIDYDCPRSKTYLQQNSERRFMNSSFNWLIWSQDKYNSSIEQLNFNIDSEVTWVHPEPSLDQVILYDLYKINYSWPVNGTVAGHWSRYTGLEFNLTEYKYFRRQDLRGIVYRAGLVVRIMHFVNNIPTTNLEEELLKPENKRLDSMATYNYRLFLLMQQMFNFSKNIIHTNAFGYVVEDGKLEGMVKMMRDRDVDMSISAMLLNNPRMDLSDYCPVSTWELRICAMFRHPQITASYGVLLKPFEPSLWLGCGVMWFLMMVALRFISFFESSYHIEDTEHGDLNNETEGAWTWSDTLVIIMGAVSQQGEY
ncbi:hypothetical protein ANN_13554 [Periplaneta americana]|uniref:Ionotropic receptor 75a N-terminal domain-containing protein n=1 Tax=Periplaneta americana TaxID=6978 RepID=A0ABQ8TLT3_PERAM|nr:hypothetical protein ANN_13554 [Periplaneta americana]